MMFNGVYMLSRHAGNGEKYALIMEPREEFAICNLVPDFGEDISTWFDCSLFHWGGATIQQMIQYLIWSNTWAFTLKFQQMGWHTSKVFPIIYTWSKTSTTRNPAWLDMGSTRFSTFSLFAARVFLGRSNFIEIWCSFFPTLRLLLFEFVLHFFTWCQWINKFNPLHTARWQ